MKGLFFRMIIAASGFVSLYTISERSARADEWGASYPVLIQSRRSDPVWRMQAAHREALEVVGKGRSFPTCAGAGFQTSRPLYEPYYCNAGYRLSAGYGPSGRDATCISTSLQAVSDSFASEIETVAIRTKALSRHRGGKG